MKYLYLLFTACLLSACGISERDIETAFSNNNSEQIEQYFRETLSGRWTYDRISEEDKAKIELIVSGSLRNNYENVLKLSDSLITNVDSHLLRLILIDQYFECRCYTNSSVDFYSLFPTESGTAILNNRDSIFTKLLALGEDNGQLISERVVDNYLRKNKFSNVVKSYKEAIDEIDSGNTDYQVNEFKLFNPYQEFLSKHFKDLQLSKEQKESLKVLMNHFSTIRDHNITIREYLSSLKDQLYEYQNKSNRFEWDQMIQIKFTLIKEEYVSQDGMTAYFINVDYPRDLADGYGELSVLMTSNPRFDQPGLWSMQVLKREPIQITNPRGFSSMANTYFAIPEDELEMMTEFREKKLSILEDLEVEINQMEKKIKTYNSSIADFDSKFAE